MLCVPDCQTRRDPLSVSRPIAIVTFATALYLVSFSILRYLVVHKLEAVSVRLKDLELILEACYKKDIGVDQLTFEEASVIERYVAVLLLDLLLSYYHAPRLDGVASVVENHRHSTLLWTQNQNQDLSILVLWKLNTDLSTFLEELEKVQQAIRLRRTAAMGAVKKEGGR